VIRLVALDAAGTLIHLREPVGETYGRVAAAHGARAPVPAWRLEDAFRRVHEAAPPMVFAGEPAARVAERERCWWRERVREVFRAADQSVRFGDFDAFFAALFAHYARADAWQPAPGAARALAELRAAGRRTAVLSNFDHRLAAILAGLGLAGFEAVLCPADLGAAKPDPDFFALAAARLDVEPSEAVYVGDDPALDLVPARGAGWRTIDARSLATLGALPQRVTGLEAEGAAAVSAAAAKEDSG
jgi:putative hydrolase of the HAD superfamily